MEKDQNTNSMNFKSTKMPESHKLIPNEINFKRSGQYVALSNLSI